MSRIAKKPIIIPSDVKVTLDDGLISIQGKNGVLSRIVNRAVEIKYIDNTLTFNPYKSFIDGWAQAGTFRSIINAMIIGVNQGFIKKLQLVGIGYRASVKDNIINLSLGFSHSINHFLPLGVIAECPIQTEIVLKSADKQLIGQVAADLRSYRPPEPYKGKGICYLDEQVRIKEAKKK
ncbi:50S ribosomal protein L6 [Candidatus Pantoea edessiphila]|uniref:50S ribosomal protein L6 n=1 Tax=Candidatus Pantoea edessiphila TaxID=2044610 RepID=A0A2P5SXX8_9GAMM|nr:50S ribosomal protein L6 [Candidatus Pantoea edessiphila]MBK4775919.1 50S ribosomal protein L6 [Pantoea sp. Edef]PPI87189.1 50S ribosomal protein L6 [Candidatus Pantoea edessiphila]